LGERRGEEGGKRDQAKNSKTKKGHDGTEYLQKKTHNMMMEVAVIVFSCFSIFALGHLVLSSSLEKARRG
jgi:hypothetical protein